MLGSVEESRSEELCGDRQPIVAGLRSAHRIRSSRMLGLSRRGDSDTVAGADVSDCELEGTNGHHVFPALVDFESVNPGSRFDRAFLDQETGWCIQNGSNQGTSRLSVVVDLESLERKQNGEIVALIAGRSPRTERERGRYRAAFVCLSLL